ncbi:hypothetical protein KRR40_27675 [Niabella defluvii]|nr:hypothetical protein KRR40_27675 [Niabella sp. I65]
MPGNPLSEFPSQQKPYVKFQKEGAHYDKNGVQINTGDIPEAHIPLSEFDFSKMPKFD